MHHDNPVCRTHRCQTVGDNDGGAVLHQMFERILHQFLAFGIERTCRLVKQEDWRIAQHRAGDGDPLPLPAGKPCATLTQIGVEALGEFAQEIAGIGLLRRAPDGIIIGEPIAVAQVVPC